MDDLRSLEWANVPSIINKNPIAQKKANSKSSQNDPFRALFESQIRKHEPAPKDGSNKVVSVEKAQTSNTFSLIPELESSHVPETNLINSNARVESQINEHNADKPQEHSDLLDHRKEADFSAKVASKPPKKATEAPGVDIESSPESSKAINELVRKGFSLADSRIALRNCNNDYSSALELLNALKIDNNRPTRTPANPNNDRNRLHDDRRHRRSNHDSGSSNSLFQNLMSSTVQIVEGITNTKKSDWKSLMSKLKANNSSNDIPAWNRNRRTSFQDATSSFTSEPFKDEVDEISRHDKISSVNVKVNESLLKLEEEEEEVEEKKKEQPANIPSSSLKSEQLLIDFESSIPTEVINTHLNIPKAELERDLALLETAIKTSDNEKILMHIENEILQKLSGQSRTLQFTLNLLLANANEKIGNNKVALSNLKVCFKNLEEMKDDDEYYSRLVSKTLRPINNIVLAKGRNLEALEQFEEAKKHYATYLHLKDSNISKAHERCKLFNVRGKTTIDTKSTNENRQPKRQIPNANLDLNSSAALNNYRSAEMRNQNIQNEKNECKEFVSKKIDAWVNGKNGNLRALLSDLDNVLWPECGWVQIDMAQLITASQVKRAYMKAISCVHPDKVVHRPIKDQLIAENVFATLNDSWQALQDKKS